MNNKSKVAILSIFSNTFLIIIKIISGLISGSVSIFSEAIHSAMDLLASFIAFLSVRVSDNPPDKEHPYGHGKYENISGVIEALLIFIAAAWIIIEAIEKIKNPQKIDFAIIGVVVMFISAIINFFVAKKLYKTAKEEDSIAIEADALHLKTDIYTSLGVGFGLLIIWITDIYMLDPIIAIIVAIFIIKESYHLLKNAFNPLLDVSLSENEIKIIDEILKENNLSYHNLKTRKSGAYRFAEMHLELPSEMTLAKAHDICDMIEDKIKDKIRFIELNIHIEPLCKK